MGEKADNVTGDTENELVKRRGGTVHTEKRIGENEGKAAVVGPSEARENSYTRALDFQ